MHMSAALHGRAEACMCPGHSAAAAHLIGLRAAEGTRLGAWVSLVMDVTSQDIVGGQHNVCRCQVGSRHHMKYLAQHLQQGGGQIVLTVTSANHRR